MSHLKRNGVLRWIPSYLRRQGKVTPGQKKAIREYWRTYGVEFRYGQIIDRTQLFPKAVPGDSTFLEIGFGMGENLIHQSIENPDAWILGIEVHQPGIGSALTKITDSDRENIKLMRGDARLILTDFLSEDISFDRVSILFPDPWPDPESEHRRIVQPDLLDLLESRMQSGAVLHIATDIEIYKEHCLRLLSGRASWRKLGSDVDLSGFRCCTI